MPLIDLTPDAGGNLVLRPVSRRLRRRIAGELARRTGFDLEVVYLPSAEAERFAAMVLRPAQLRELRAGWNLRIRLSETAVAALYEHQAAEAAHTGRR